MKCGPDGCPIVAFSDLTPAEQRVERQRIAKKMSDQGFTEQQIAKQLGVNHSTISRDLSEFVHDAQIKPAKTASNPKGAGRPKGSGTKRKGKKNDTLAAEQAAKLVLDSGMTHEQAGTQTGAGSELLVRVAVAREEGRREVKADPEIERADLSMTAQEKLDVAIRQHKRKLDMEFEARVLEECKRRLDEISLPHYAKQLQELERSISNRKGIMGRITYRKILACLHPDRVADEVLKKRYEEAFRLFTELEKRVLDEKESPTEFRKMPRTYEELMAARAKVQAANRAKRAARKGGGIEHRG